MVTGHTMICSRMNVPFHHPNTFSYRAKKVREKFRECQNHKPQLIPDTKKERKQTKPNERKSNKRAKKH